MTKIPNYKDPAFNKMLEDLLNNKNLFSSWSQPELCSKCDGYGFYIYAIPFRRIDNQYKTDLVKMNMVEKTCECSIQNDSNLSNVLILNDYR